MIDCNEMIMSTSLAGCDPITSCKYPRRSQNIIAITQYKATIHPDVFIRGGALLKVNMMSFVYLIILLY